jgi:hypothetical protein
MRALDFKTTNYFRGTAMFFGGLLVFAAFMLILTNWILAIVLLFVSIVIFSTHYRLRIDLDNKTYKRIGIFNASIEETKKIMEEDSGIKEDALPVTNQ